VKDVSERVEELLVGLEPDWPQFGIIVGFHIDLEYSRAAAIEVVLNDLLDIARDEGFEVCEGGKYDEITDLVVR
jgi:hypothetical protein